MVHTHIDMEGIIFAMSKRTIFKYKLDKETGKIIKTVINEYDEGQWCDGTKWYAYRGKSSRQYVYSDNMDIVKNWTIYSFTYDFNAAKDAFQEYIMLEQRKYETKATEMFELYGKIV